MTMNNEEREWMLDVPTQLGQMRHIDGSVPHPTEPKKAIVYQQLGAMKMPTTVRADLIARGWKLVKS